MTTKEIIELDAILDPVPDNGEVIELVMRMAPHDGAEIEERRLDLNAITPGDDRLANEIAGVGGTLAAIRVGPPTTHLVVWCVAGRQMKKRRDPVRVLENNFTLRRVAECELIARVALDEDDPDDSGNPAQDGLDSLDIHGDSEDPTQAEST